MSAITRIRPISRTKVQQAIHALGPDLSDVMFGLCDRYSQGCATGVPLTLHKLGAACQGASIVDGNGSDIPLKVDLLMVSPPGAGQIVLQEQADRLVMIETETTPEAIAQLARFTAAVQLHAEQRKQIEVAIKAAACKMVRLQARLAQRRELEAREPKEANYPDHLTEMIAWNQRLSDLQISIDQAQLDGDAGTTTALRMARKALLATPPSSFEVDYRRWGLKYAAVESQIVLLQGADEEVAHLVAQKQALLAEDASTVEPALPRVLYWNKSIPEVRKTILSGWPAAIAMYAGEAVVKTLAKHRTALADVCGGRLLSAHPLGRVLLNVIGTTTPAAFIRDINAIGAEGAAALGATFVIAADTHAAESGPAPKPSDPDCLGTFDNRLKELMMENVRAMLGEGFEPQRITVSPEAASLAAAKHDELHATRIGNALHPALDAFLMRARVTFYVIAGLLYLWRRETGLLSLSTMEDAIDVGDYMIEQFELTVAMAREVPAEEIDAEALVHALCGYVGQQMEKGKATPFEIKLSTLHSKAKDFGLTRARVSGALKLLVASRWIMARQDGLDTVFDLDPHRFSSMNRPF